MATENIDIKVSEDGSRVAARNVDSIGTSADKSASSVDKLNAALGKSSTWQEKLKAAGNAALESARSMKLMEGAGLLLRGAMAAVATAAGTLLATGILLLVKGLYEGWQQSIALRRELLALGGVAGTSASAFEMMAANAGAATGRINEAREAVVALSRTGKVSFDLLNNLGQGVVNMAFLTGDSIDSLTNKIASLGTDTSKTILKLNQEYGLFNVTIYDQVRALEDQGKTQEAANLAAKALADDTHDRVNQAVADMGYLERTMEGLKQAYGDFKAWTLSLGRDKTLSEQYDKELSKIHDLQELANGTDNAFSRATGAHATAVKNLNDQIAKTLELNRQIYGKGGEVDKSNAAAAAAQADKDALAANARIQDRLETLGKVNRLQTEINKNIADYNKLWEQSQRTGKTPAALQGVTRDAQGNFSGGSYDKAVAGIVERYAPKGGRGRSGVDHSAQTAARELQQLSDAVERYAGRSSTAARAQMELANAQDTFAQGIKAGLLTQEQADTYLADMAQKLKDQVDPLGAVNRHLDENMELLRLNADERDRYNQELDITQALQRQGKSLDDEELKQLRAKLVAQQELSKVMQIQDQLLANSSGKRQENNTRRLDTIVSTQQNSGGAYTKNDAFTDATAGMGDIFKGTKEAIEANKAAFQEMYDYIDELRQKGVVSEQSASEAKRALWVQENAVHLQAASTALNQLSSLMNTHSKKAFAVGKAAAIAQTIINTYASAVGAFKALADIPYVGPFLGAAAAAAAIASGMAQVQAIRSQQMPAYRTGGEFMVGGGGVSDSQIVAFRATPGEHVAITPPEQQRARPEASALSGRVTFNQNITQVIAGKPDRRTPEQYARQTRRATIKELEN
jgi:phage-related minor tail protein